MREQTKLKRRKIFVNAAVDILKKEGLAGFSARKIAKETGYNVASMYNYFENLDHLENIASIYFTTDYLKEFTKSTKNIEDNLIIYLNLWILFTKHAMLNPNYFYNVFFSALSQTGKVNLFEEYYVLFPSKRPKSKILEELFKLPRTVQRENYLMDMCVEAGSITPKAAGHVKAVHLGYFKIILTEIVKNKLYQPSVKLFQQHFVDYIYTLYYYADDRYNRLFDEIIKFYSEDRDSYENFFDYHKVEDLI